MLFEHDRNTDQICPSLRTNFKEGARESARQLVHFHGALLQSGGG